MTFLEENRALIFKKYSKEELIKDIDSYISGSGKLTKTLNHFFEELIFESCGRKSKISPMDVLMDDNKIAEIFEYIKTKPKFYTQDDISNLKSYFRNAVSWVRKVANFCPKTAYSIQNRYNADNKKINVLDTSAGFGSRMSAAILHGNNYCGIDPNKRLYEQLKRYLFFLKENKKVEEDIRCGLYCRGSESFIPELLDKFDVSFTSPPYFNLEKYSGDDCESTKNYDNYSLWVEKFVLPTCENTYKYLRISGYAMINIKNLDKKHPLYDDFFNGFSRIDGFQFVETFDMKIASKKNYSMGINCNIPDAEPVMVFQKIK